MDKGSSQAYWENKDTGETTWNDPNSSNWEKHYDNKSRNDFYVNNKTGHDTLQTTRVPPSSNAPRSILSR